MNKKTVKIVSFVIAIIFLLGIIGPLAYVAISAPMVEMGSLYQNKEDMIRELNNVNEQIEDAQKNDKQLNEELNIAKDVLNNNVQKSNKRIAIICEKGTGGYLSIILGAENISDFADRVVIAREISKYHKNTSENDKKTCEEIEEEIKQNQLYISDLESTKEEIVKNLSGV